jgi:uncharacterized protein
VGDAAGDATGDALGDGLSRGDGVACADAEALGLGLLEVAVPPRETDPQATRRTEIAASAATFMGAANFMSRSSRTASGIHRARSRGGLGTFGLPKGQSGPGNMARIATQVPPRAAARRLTLSRPSARFWLRALAVILVVWLAASFIAEQVELHPPRRALGPTPAMSGMAYSDVSFKTADGLTLRGWWIPGTLHKTIVMVHGLSNNRQEPLHKAGYLHQAGYNLLVFDLRGHGKSDGSGSTMGYREPADVRAAVTEARSLDQGPIALFGYSLGASVAVEDAAIDPNVSAVIEDSGFSSVGDIFLARFSEVTRMPDLPWAAALVAFGELDIGTSLWNVAPVAMAARLHKPMLAIVGDADTIVPPAEGLALFAAAQGPKELLEVPGAGHVQAFNTVHALYEKTVLDFLAKNLGA